MTTTPFVPERVRGRILLIEDASVFREMEALQLRHAGYVVVTCDQPHLALLEAATQPFEFAVVNSDAAGLDRLEFLLTLRRHRPHIAIIFVAAVLTVEVARDLTANGVAVVLQRPVDPTQLLEKINEIAAAAMRPGSSLWSSLPEVPGYDSQSRAPFAPGSTASFSTPGSRSPFRPDSAAPFTSAHYGNSASPFRSTTASPFSPLGR